MQVAAAAAHYQIDDDHVMAIKSFCCCAFTHTQKRKDPPPVFRSTGERVVDACLNYKSAFDLAITFHNSRFSTFLDEFCAAAWDLNARKLRSAVLQAKFITKRNYQDECQLVNRERGAINIGIYCCNFILGQSTHQYFLRRC